MQADSTALQPYSFEKPFFFGKITKMSGHEFTPKTQKSMAKKKHLCYNKVSN